MNMMQLPPHTDLARYLEEIRKFPLLTVELEQDLSRRWRAERDPEAARMLVGSHLRLVVKAARGYLGYGLPLEDLIAEGNVGLMQALDKFDPDRGFRLATYAMWWIRAAIQEYILHQHSLVKLGTTAAQKKLFFNLRRLKAQLRELEDGDLSPETVKSIAEDLNVPETEVIEMNRRLGSGDYSLNTGIATDSETEWQDLLVEEGVNQETRIVEADERVRRHHLLEQGLERLTDRERDILSERRLRDNPLTLDDLSKRYGVSRERVRQIEVRAFDKLQKAIRSATMSNNPVLAAAA
jgi:RNA polymerase sigma-32 factor